MRAYVITTAAFFALVAIAHLLRIPLESTALARDLGNWAVIGVAGALCAWGISTLRRAR